MLTFLVTDNKLGCIHWDLSDPRVPASSFSRKAESTQTQW